MWNFIIPAAVGALTSAAMGKDPIQGAVVGGVSGGLLGGMEGNLFNLGSSTATSAGTGAATSGATAFGANQAPLAVASGLGSGTTAGLTTSLPQTTGQYSSLLGGNAGLQNYTAGMDYGLASGGLSSSAMPTSQVLANNIQPIRDSSGQIIGPDMSARQTFIDTTPSATNANFGTVDPNTLDYTQGQRVQDKFGYSDGVANKANLEIGPDMSQVTKPDVRDLSKAGGYEKPLYEKAYDSIIGAVKKDPLGTLGTGALVATSLNPRRPTPQVSGGGGSITKGTPPQDVGQILKVRRPTRFA